jgi:hypothetical protein
VTSVLSRIDILAAMGHVSVGGVSFDFGPLSVPVDTREFDYSDRSSNVEAVWTANVSLISLVGLFVGLRIFVRSYVMRKIFKDDGKVLSGACRHILMARSSSDRYRLGFYYCAGLSLPLWYVIAS